MLTTTLASVQVRQKVPHKRTFLYLEQVILKHGAHSETVNIKEAPNGLDFYFSARNSAEKMVEFLHSIVPCTFVSHIALIPCAHLTLIFADLRNPKSLSVWISILPRAHSSSRSPFVSPHLTIQYPN